MADKRGFLPTSRYGRTIKPTEKVRGLLRENTAKMLREMNDNMNNLEMKARTLMRDEGSPREAREIYEEWNAVTDEYLATESEYSRYLPVEDVAVHDAMMKDRMQSCSVFSNDVEQYISVLSEKIPAKSKQRFLLDETARLESELRAVSEQLTRSMQMSGDSTRASSSEPLPTPSSRQAPPSASSMITISEYPDKQETDRNEHLRPIKTVRYSTPIDCDYELDTTTAPSTVRCSSGERSHQDSTVEVLSKLASLLDGKRDRLPRMEPESFTGDFLQFPIWIKSFTALIEGMTSSPSELLFYLGKYTKGDAHECIAGYLSLYSEDAYERAKKALVSRYGDKIRVAAAYRRKLANWPVVKKGDGIALRRLSDFLWQCHAAMDTVSHLSSLENGEEMNKICKVLPTYIVEKWARVVDRWYYHDEYDDDGCDDRPEGQYPPFHDLCKLVSREARIATGPTSSLGSDVCETKSSPSGGGKRARSFSTGSKAESSDVKKSEHRRPPAVPLCQYCNGKHWISQCPDFLGRSGEEKKAYASEHRLCYGCLRRSHGYRSCRSKIPDLFKDPVVASGSAVSHCVGSATGRADEVCAYYSMIVPVEVAHPRDESKTVKVYALLDTQSDCCFVSEEVLSLLDAPYTDVDLHLETMGASSVVPSKMVRGLRVKGVECVPSLALQKCYSRGEIPASRSQIPDPEIVRSWDHLSRVADELQPLHDDWEIGLLIGYNCPDALRPLLTVQEGLEKPYAVLTSLGWSVMGQFPIGQADSAGDEETAHCHATSARALTITDFRRALDLDFEEPADPETLMSQDDKVFMHQMRESVTQLSDSHFQMDLPFRDENATMPNNRSAALKRLMSLKRRMLRDESFCEQYKTFMTDLIDSGYAEPAPDEHSDGHLNYLPHHGVRHPRKPGKIRGVFDGGSEFGGVSLNSLLLHGPDLTNSIVGVLSRFRSNKIAFMCDIKAMFLQVRVSEKHRDFLRFLWFEDGDPLRPVKEYRMASHSFGVTSSPSCANYALKEVANRYEHEFGSDVANFLRRHFYVDDGLKAVPDVQNAVQLFMAGNEMCGRGGFELLKFTCNEPEVEKKIPAELLATGARDRLAIGGGHGQETSLGIVWDLLTDSFMFKVRDMVKEFTRRNLLSMLSGIYDPLGLLSPLLLVGRLILQGLCCESVAWDTPIPEYYATRWRDWCSELQLLTELRIPRCVKRTLDSYSQARMHMFSDASNSGYGVCVYLQLMDQDGGQDVTLLMAKARVPPKRPVTMPRLELQAAVLSAKVAASMQKELDYDNLQCWYWCDSKVVLGYVANTTRKFHIYVTNRVHYIRENTQPDHWRYVASADNPADLASRGCDASALTDNQFWWSGPGFIRDWCPDDGAGEYLVDESDPEVKKEPLRAHAVKAERGYEVVTCLQKCSTWRKLIRVVCVWQRYIAILRRKVGEVGQAEELLLTARAINVAELHEAERVAVKLLQQSVFADEYNALFKLRRYPVTPSESRERKAVLKQSSNLFKLDIYLGDDDLIHVGGRIRRADLPPLLKHPRLLPKMHHLTSLIIQHYHRAARHLGRQMTLGAVRGAGYWVLHGRAAVDRYTRACSICKRLRGQTMTQMMSDLPQDRLEEAPPFTYSGVDFCGPFLIKDGRVMKKRWICAFNCLVSRASHYEVAHYMTTDSFINAFRRFVSRRGSVRELRCDRGTNFVGASNELRQALDEMDLSQIHEELLSHHCDWVTFEFNTPKSSHMGGVWERINRMARSSLAHVISQHGDRLTDEMFLTFVTEAEAITNSRPLVCVDTSDPWSEPPLTPATLLTLRRESPMPPPGNFPDSDVYSTRQWRRVQVLVDQFWRRWRRDFLPELQSRKKWATPRVELKQGDVVILVDEAVPRMKWPLARVLEVRPSKDGLVRKALLKTSTTELERPIHKMIYLCSPD